MLVKEFDYQLPTELIARYPQAQRSASRLLCLNRENGDVVHSHFRELMTRLQPGDLLVFNNTRVIPARLHGRKASGGKIEVLIERVLDQQQALVHIRASKAPQADSILLFEQNYTARVLGRAGDLFQIIFNTAENIFDILNKIGHMPLPRYMQREDESMDKERYQTVYACRDGAVAAPTAGLHFDSALLQQLTEYGVKFAYVTLHVGAGTFQPVRCERIQDHIMHSEYIEVSPEACQAIQQTKAQNKRVIAVGTTSVRCLETASQTGQLQAYQGETKIFIYPGYQFNCIDALITNFHLPESTLLMLVSAFAGKQHTKAAYQMAIEQQYRFYSYGDAMFIF